jgi:peptidoglycan-associated lipoprotein
MLVILLAARGAAQDATPDTRPSLPTIYGDTGIWFVPTGETLPSHKVSASLFRAEWNRTEGLTNIADIGLTFAVGVTDHVELFGSWGVVRERRGVRSPFFVTSDSEYGGVAQEHPFLHDAWSKTLGAPLILGAKAGLLSQAKNDGMSLAVRGTLFFPTGPQEGSTDSFAGRFDVIASREIAKMVELTGTVGAMLRSDPDAFDVSKGVAWGIGTQFPTRSRLRGLVELSGEWMVNNNVRVLTPPFVANDGSIAPLVSGEPSPIDFKAGLVWQDRRGFFIHGGINWSNDAGDHLVGLQNIEHSPWAFDVRIGFHPGTKVHVPPPLPPPPPTPVAAPPPPPPPPPPNRNPVVSMVTCDPCTVEVGKTSQLRATATDPDGDAITYRWSAPAGTFNNPTIPNPVWTAPNDPGTVPITVTVTDSRGGQGTGTVTLTVVRPTPRTYTFEDVHFDFDKYNLKPEAIMILDEAVRTLNANPELRVTIEGHTDSVGTNEYNLGLGNRRANSVRTYLIDRGIAASRLNVISYGEERPKATNDTAEGRAINRRAVIVTIQ